MRPTLALLLVTLGPLGCDSTSLAPRWTLTAPGITVEVERAPYHFTVRDASGQVVLDSLGAGKKDGYGAVGFTTGVLFWDHVVSPGYFTFDTKLDPWRDSWTVIGAAQPDAATLELTMVSPSGRIHVHHSVRASTLRVEAKLDGGTPRAWSAAFASPADEAFMGFGERYNRTDQRGLTLYSWNEEGGLGRSEATPKGATNPWPSGETMTYYSVPFFLSSKGYGFWLDSTWRNEFNLASDRSDAWRVWHIGPSLAYEIYVPIPNDPRRFTKSILDLFTATTGRPMVPPTWAYGPRRRFGATSTRNGVPEVQAMRDAGLAVTSVDDNTHFLPDGNDVGQEPALAAWIQNATRLGYHVDGYFNPYVADLPMGRLAADRQKGLDNHWFLRDGGGQPSIVWLISGSFLNVFTVDVTSRDATAWFTNMFQRALTLGYSGWMYDFGEYVQPEVVASNGMTGEELHNLFPVLYDKAAHDAGAPFFYARSGYTGSQQYTPVVWGGDPDASFDDANGLPAMVRGGLNLGVSGVANWGSDIGGFKCGGDGHAGANGELVTRWIEFGSMSPDMHDEDACADAMDSGSKASIWSSTDAQAAWKTYARLHTRLFPYFYTLAQEAHATGTPILRTLFLEQPGAGIAGIGDTFFVGPSLLAAPVLQRGAITRDVPLPAGDWLDWQDQLLYSGPNQVTVPAPLGKLPLFLRDGALIPLYDPSIETLSDGAHLGVIGPAEVADVYDVVGFVTRATGAAHFAGYDGSALDVTWSGGFSPPPSLALAQSAAELATCAGCYLVETLPKIGRPTVRVRISGPPSVTAGGLTVGAQSPRRIRWDLFLVD